MTEITIPPDEARERAAVIWWIGRRDTRTRPPSNTKAMREFDRIMKCRGAELERIIKAHEAFTKRQGRKGVAR